MEFSSLAAALPLGMSSFEDIRESGTIYVDKTELVFRLAQTRGRYFLTRPRRFGKTVLVSTFESLFSHGLKYFKGLAIELLWNDAQTYKVVRLDFSSVKSFSSLEEFRSEFEGTLNLAFQPFGFEYEPKPAAPFMQQLSAWMMGQPSASFVLLIDEYDAPLLGKLNDEALFDAARNELAKFFALVKMHDRLWRFFFMTGITKLHQTGIFSDLNNLRDISLSGVYSAIAGYTQEEIRRCFMPQVEEAARVLSLSPEEVLSGMKENYDGFCFDALKGRPREPVRVHAPWSVLCFLSEPSDGFLNYWVESGGQITVLHQYLRSHTLQDPREYITEKTISADRLRATSDIADMDDIVLLTQTGYLTIKRRAGPDLIVSYPNREVACSMAALYSEWLLSNPETRSVRGLIAKAAASGNAEMIMEELGRAFLAINCMAYPVTSEAVCQGLVQLFFRGAGLYAAAETAGAFGRSDIEFDAGRLHWVFELKFQKAEESAERAAELLEEAKRQIAERQYGAASGKELVRVAAVFSEKERRFVLWAKA